MFDKAAELPEGFAIRDHAKVSGNPCGSAPEPLNVTVVPCTTVWLGPAFAVGGGRRLVAIVTVDGGLSTLPSLTTNCATYVPARSAVKVGSTTFWRLRWAVLPAGTVMRLQK